VSDVIRWENPPPHGNTGPREKRPSKFQAAADAMRARCGDWALLVEGITTGNAGRITNDIRNGKPYPFAPAGSFEARCVGPAGGTSSKVYARYVGEQDGAR
jgi:hypothetical protein